MEMLLVDLNDYSSRKETSVLKQEGQLNGQGTIYYFSIVKVVGNFKNGLKSGQCSLHFTDGSVLEGTFENDDLEGAGTLRFPDGKRVEANYINGVPNGPAKEFNKKGLLTCSGQYANGTRIGIWFSYRDDGGFLVGNVDNQGELTGNDIAYIYPDHWTALVGEFKKGVMKKARAARVIRTIDGIPEFEFIQSGAVYKFDMATHDVISSDKKLRDPYESERVYVKDSLISGAKEGLFARVDVGTKVVMAFYSGLRLAHKEIDIRSWEENAYTMVVDDQVVIDLPPEYTATDKYCASLGHKANHRFHPNCRFDNYNHPRFGSIMCIITIRPVKRDEELTINYGYGTIEFFDDPDVPLWYKSQLPIFKRVGADVEFEG